MKSFWFGSVKIFVWSAVFVQILQAQPQQCDVGFATPPRIDPRDRGVSCLPELGRMAPRLPCQATAYRGESFGQQIIPIGDCNGDSLADWIVGRIRCDTSIMIWGYPQYPEELLLYHGVRGGLPPVESGVRIGPTELFSSTKILAAQDWDGDGRVDLAISMQILGDTSSGNVGANYDLKQLVIMWGNATGSFTITDTTRLSNSRTSNWLSLSSAVSVDIDRDFLNDLVLLGGAGVENGKVVSTAPIFLFRGHNGERWGRNGIPRTADWRWWNPPPMNTLAAGDHDGDGILDLYLHNNHPPSIGQVSVLYGRADAELPDTTNVETIDLAIANGKASLFNDVTGDHIPELLVTSGSEYRIKVFVGIRGQRLLEQYGPGHASLDTASPHWWKHPWAELWQPKKINDDWPGPGDVLYDVGDIDLDGVGDVCGYNNPWLVCYRGGDRMDSLIDAMIDCRAAGLAAFSEENPKAVAVLGDVDGSGLKTIAMGYNGVLYVQPSRNVQTQTAGKYRMLPEGTGVAGVKTKVRRVKSEMMEVRVVPNPAGGEVRIEWIGEPLGKMATITVSDVLGREIWRGSAPGTQSTMVLSVNGYAAGRYLVAVDTIDRSGTTLFVVQ